MKLSINYLVLAIAAFVLCACQSDTEKQTNKRDLAPSSNTKSMEKPQLEAGRYNVGILIMDGVYNTELTAPYDIFQHTQYREGIKAMNVFMVAKSLDGVKTFEGMRILPDYSYNEPNFPKIDILVVPSAEHHLDSDLEDLEMIDFVKQTAENAEYVTSHCDGAFVLAKAGLLAEKNCTTFPSDIAKMREMFPESNVLDSTLFVHDGKFITSAGGAKSFEAALYLCEGLYGKKIAQELAGGLVIDWNLEEVDHVVGERALF